MYADESSLRWLGSFDTVDAAAKVYAKEYLRMHGSAPKRSRDCVESGRCINDSNPAKRRRITIGGCLRTGSVGGNASVDLSHFKTDRNCTGFLGVKCGGRRYDAQIYGMWGCGWDRDHG